MTQTGEIQNMIPKNRQANSGSFACLLMADEDSRKPVPRSLTKTTITKATHVTEIRKPRIA